MSTLSMSQVMRLLQIADESGITPERFEGLSRAGVLSDVFKCQDPKIVDRHSLQKVLRGLLVVKTEFPVWKTIQIGGVNRDELVASYNAKLGSLQMDFERQEVEKLVFPTAEVTSEIHLARVSPRDLGFTEDPTHKELIRTATAHGLTLCPFEAVFHLHQVYDQPEREIVWLGTIIPGDHRMLGLHCGYRDGRYGSALAFGSPKFRPQLNSLHVFVRD